jgi:hypothetical protein
MAAAGNDNDDESGCEGWLGPVITNTTQRDSDAV